MDAQIPPAVPAKSGANRTVIIIVIVLLIICLVPVLLFACCSVLPLILGPAVGNVFSNIIMDI